ncbi:MAG TPA: nickel pincer cofactor biosynthesis protein LarC [Acidobacteriaceae bacterium]
MRIAYLDCFAGISGDMFLGALVDAGVPLAVLEEATAALKIGASLKVETVDRSGISCTKVHVMDDGHLAEKQEADARIDEQKTQAPYTQLPETQHLHKAGHAHGHEVVAEMEGHEDGHAHGHGRSLRVIRGLIEAAELTEPVKRTAIRAFELLGQSEAKIHNVRIEEIHFHEVGAVDAIVDIVAASAGIHHLEVGAWYCSPLNVGGGMVECAHGTFPVPAPATADLLRGFPTYSAHVQKELVTPTGAALLRAIEPVFGQQPAMRVEQIGYGAGTRNPKGFPNVLRLSVGSAEETTDALGRTASKPTETVTVLETALDDLSPQIIAWVAEAALAAGALDVMLTPVIMKKGRPGTLLTMLCQPAESGALERLMLRETSTLGVRVRQEQRFCLDRHHAPVQTVYGEIRIKIGSLGGEVLNAAPEFEDCRAAAMKHGVALKEVQQVAIAAYQKSMEAAKDGDGATV